MTNFYKVISHLFHPLYLPISGTLAYFFLTPKYTTLPMQGGNIVPIFILTVIIPIISYLILKNIGLTSTIFLPEAKERKYPIYIILLVLLMIVYKVIPNNYTSELYYFFIGLITAYITILTTVYFNFKASIHLMSIGSIWMYLIALSVHFELNITLAISITTLCTGIVYSARLYLKAHSHLELITGLVIGVLSQLLTIKYWL